MNARRPLAFFAGLGVVLALLAIDQWIFITWFSATHLKWYLTVGASINLFFSVAAMAWGDMEKHTGLISPHPLSYLGACLQLVGLPVYALGTHLRSNKGELRSLALFDIILTILLLLTLFAAMVIWLLVIAPPQYFVYLICGSPMRILAQSKRQPIAQLKGTQLTVAEIGSDETIPEGWWSVSLNKKPVAVAGLFASLFFLAAKLMIG